jgi:hypothetical protein
MRYFNTLGPVNETEHYVVPRRELITDLVAQIEQGKYFTIFAPRQMGKTTLLRRLSERLQTQPHYLPITLSFEAFENWSEEDFLYELGDWLGSEILLGLQTISHPKICDVQPLLTTTRQTDYPGFWRFFRQLRSLIPQIKVILIIDEFDGTPQAAISGLLQTWRQIYLASQPPRTLHSVVLIGIRNVATLNFGRSSPFNIASELRLSEFTESQVRHLLAQYTDETSQAFDPGVVEEIYQQTGGQPFLVNRLAAILTQEIATERDKAITLPQLEIALEQFIRETNYNFQTIIRQAEPHRDDVLNILFGAPYEFNLNTPLVHHLFMHGVVSQSAADYCQIANPIYAKVLLAAFRPLRLQLQADILTNGYDLRPHLLENQLQMRILLSRFRQFVERRGREAFKVTPMPQEATGQYLLMAYLSSVVRQAKGDLFTEVESGEGRLDLIVVHRGRRYIVETKIWRGQAKFDEGLDQLVAYLETEGQKEGYLVVFHARPQVYGKLNHAQLEFTLKHKGYTIHVYLVRLGAIWKKKSQTQTTR